MSRVTIQSVQKHRCPYCNSQRTYAEEIDYDSDKTWATITMKCSDCHRYYDELYTMKFIGLEVGDDRLSATVGMEVECKD